MVILMRIVFFLVLVPLSFYLAAIGFAFSAVTVKSAIPEVWFEKIVFYSKQLPYFPIIKESIFNRLDYWYLDSPEWWTVIAGIPLILMSLSIFLINFFNLYYSIFSWTYNRAHCPFCKEP